MKKQEQSDFYFFSRDVGMAIHKLPDYVINRLKAGEVVQRPASLLKELVENALDAGARALTITINDGGKSFLSVEDDGTGIELSDMELLLERYATSKIESEQDLLSLESYGFRGEALASIAEVSKITVLTKTKYAEIGTKLIKRGGEQLMQHVPVPFSHGTVISVEDLFYNVPARLKFLKSAQTEFYYCYNYFVDVALYHYDKAFILKKNDKITFDLKPARDLQTRILDLFKKDW
ncbi:MAG: DNA mismatch repair endonuclease MutL [bacterium]|nr:DNA mismatch repair endonuclease MutL [bacterium]